MKHAKRLILLSVMVLSATACDHSGLDDSSCVKFTAAMPSYPDAYETRVSYSGVLENGKERLDWNLGDRITIVGTRSDGSSTADYVVSDRPVPYGDRSIASISEAGGATLSWGNGTNDFTAICPSPNTRIPGGSGTMSTLGFYVSQNEAGAYIPATQNPVWTGKSGAPRMEYAPVMAEAKGLYFTGAVELLFQPAYNAFEFSFLYDKETPIELNSFSLSSPTEALSGTYSIAFSSSTGGSSATSAGVLSVPTPVLSGTGANNVVTVPLGMTLGQGEELSFTVFTLPGDHADLTLSLNTNKGTKSLLLKLKTGDPLVFPSCSKAVIRGLVIPNSPSVSFVTVRIIDGERVVTDILEPWTTDTEDCILVRQ